MGGASNNTLPATTPVDNGVPPPPVPAGLFAATAAAEPAAAGAADPATQPAAPAAEAARKHEPHQMLDLAFCCDCTGSMGAYIRSAQDNIRAIAERIVALKGQQCSLRFALVKYRDHPPQDSTFITEVYPFTKSLEVMKANIDTMVASGGGDGPEAVTAALHEVLELNWRPEASKVCVFIADAPPHGLGESGDGFPNGSPDGRDPIVIARALAQKGVTEYTIGVEPVLSTSYKYARDFFMMVASVTEGKFLPLGKADILAQVIVGTAVEGLELEQLWTQAEKDIVEDAKRNNEELTAEQLCAKVEKVMADRAQHVQMQQVAVANPYMDARYDMVNCDAFTGATSLHAARACLKSSANAHVAQETAGYMWSDQKAMCDDIAPTSMEQVSRCANKGKKKHGFFSK